MKIKFTHLLASSALLMMMALPANSSVVPGELLGVFAGNDSAAGLLDNLGIAATLIATVDTPSSIETSSLSNDGLTIDNFLLNTDQEAVAGQWSYAGPEIANIVVLKAGSMYAVYLFTDAITDSMPNIGLWNTADLDNKGLSHISVYSAVVPVPAAVWLMISGLAGLGFLRRKTD